MGIIARQLYQLQETDLAIEGNDQAQARIQAQLGESQEILRARAALAAEQQHLSELARAQKDAEWQVDDLTAKITTIDGKLYGGKIRDPKELSGLQQENEGFKKKRSTIEDTVLELMDRAETARKSITALKDQLSRLEAQWKAQQQKLGADLQQLKADHTTLESKRQAIVSQIEAISLDLYRDLRRRKGIAVAKVEQGICKGCRITLPNSDLQLAKGSGLIKCSSCGRILYLSYT